MKEIDGAFRHVRSFTIVVVAITGLLSIFAIYASFKLVSESNDRVWVLANGKAIQAFSTDRVASIPIEAKDHLKTFHHLFFTLDPDDHAIEQSIGKALYLADGSAKMLYDDLKENGYYASMISGNVSQSIEVDSIALNDQDYPFTFTCYSKQLITRQTSSTVRQLISAGSLRNVTRSDQNPHGFLIESFKIVENHDIKTERRKR